jgi:tetratricopeptide (TPR) repeat protein
VKENNSVDFKLKQQLIIFLLLFYSGSPFNDLFSQGIQDKPTRQSAIEAYSKGNYEQALKEFNELLLTFSKDPQYKYYSGACLVKLNRAPDEAVTLLKQALKGAAVVKTLPSDATFYLGRALQMSGNFNEAIESYNQFTEESGKKAARELGIPEFIEQCNAKKGEVVSAVIKPAQTVKNDKVDILIPLSQPVTKEAPAKIILPAPYEKILAEALDFQFKADSLNTRIMQQKKELEMLSGNEKAGLRLKISGNEELAVEYQNSADQKYTEADAAKIGTPVKPKQNKEVPQQVDIIVKDTIRKSDSITSENSVKKPEVPVVKQTDKEADIIKKSVVIVQKPVETYAVFELLTNPVEGADEKIIVNGDYPPGLIYRIQCGVFRNPVALSYFKGFRPVYGFKITGADKTYYYIGMFRRNSDAVKALAAVKAKGFKDALVVALSENKTVSSDRAALMEKEWSKKPFVAFGKSAIPVPADTIPPTLSFRVEVIKSKKPVKDDVIEGIKKMSGNRGLDILQTDDGNIAYLIGKFITFETAAEYTDLMIRNGYREARVVAFLGKKEIPVDTARQLFDNLE